MKPRACETCIAVVELTDGRKGQCRWCARGCPPYDPDALDRARAAKRQAALPFATTDTEGYALASSGESRTETPT